MNILSYIIPPVLGGIIALSTNWLAIIMLFRPHTEKRIFGIRVPFTPGLIPKEQTRLAKKLAQVISTKLLSPEMLVAELSDISVWPVPQITVGEALQGLEPYIDEYLPKSMNALLEFPEKYPKLDEKFRELTYKIIDENVSGFAGLFISKEKVYTKIKENIKLYLSENQDDVKLHIYNAIKNSLTEQIYDMQISEILQKEKHAFQGVFEVFIKYIAESIPIQNMIETRIASIDVAEAEEIILSVVRRELKLIVLLGGALGFLIGCLMLII